MANTLYNAAVEYRKLRNVMYEVHLVKRKKIYILKIHFPEWAFFHLAGLQHIKDITFSSTSKARIYKDILAQKITTDTISGSEFYIKEGIDVRIENLYLMETILNGDASHWIVDLQNYAQFTEIKAEYLFECIKENIFYLFIKKADPPSFVNECVGYSFFKKEERDFTATARSAKVLMIRKIENWTKHDECVSTLYIKDGYNP